MSRWNRSSSSMSRSSRFFEIRRGSATRAFVAGHIEPFLLGIYRKIASVPVDFQDIAAPPVVLDVGYGAANPDPSQTSYYGMEMNARAVLYDYVYFFPKFLPKHVNLSGVRLATNIRGAVIRLTISNAATAAARI